MEHNSNADSRPYMVAFPFHDGPLAGKSNLLATGKFGAFPPTFDSLMDESSLPICASSSQPFIRTASTAGALTFLRRFFLMIVIVGFRALFALACRLTKICKCRPHHNRTHALYLRSLMYDAAWRIVDRSITSAS